MVGDHPVAHKLQDQDEEPRVEREHPHLLLQSLHLAAGVVHSVFMSFQCRYNHQHIVSVVYKHYSVFCSSSPASDCDRISIPALASAGHRSAVAATAQTAHRLVRGERL